MDLNIEPISLLCYDYNAIQHHLLHAPFRIHYEPVSTIYNFFFWMKNECSSEEKKNHQKPDCLLHFI